MKQTIGRLVFPGCVLLALGGCAMEPGKVAAAPAATKYNCVRDTGTHLKLPEDSCVIAPGKVYTDDDLGAFAGPTLGHALGRIAR
jgi:hypothetical protein